MGCDGFPPSAVAIPPELGIRRRHFATNWANGSSDAGLSAVIDYEFSTDKAVAALTRRNGSSAWTSTP